MKAPGSARPARPRHTAGLVTRLAESEETIRAIRDGEVDAIVVAGKQGDQVFTLDGAGHAYRVLIESMHEGALTLTAEGIVLYANRCLAEMLRCPLEQVIGSSIYRFLPAEAVATLRPLLGRSAEAGTKIQVRLHAPGDAQIPVQISIRPLGKNATGPEMFGMVVTDMTEAHRIAAQKETEVLYAQVIEHAAQLERRVGERTQQLLMANEELEAFESSVSHDLRAPLRHIAGFSDALVGDFSAQLPEPARNYIKKIQVSVEKMERMIAALLDFSRVSKRSLVLEVVDVSLMWREVLAEMRPALGARQVDVTLGALPSCRADPILLRQVLVNLLSNALKYSGTRAQSIIEISSTVSSPSANHVYSIKDNGIGFDMPCATRLFGIFERLPSGKNFEGTGVGLSTVKRIVERHGGRIWAESAPDAGATFFFTIGSPSGLASEPFGT